MRLTKHDRRREIFEEGNGWTLDEDSPGSIREIQATVLFQAKLATKTEKILEPGALFDVIYTRPFATADPGDMILTNAPTGFNRNGKLGFKTGMAFIVHDGEEVRMNPEQDPTRYRYRWRFANLDSSELHSGPYRDLSSNPMMAATILLKDS